MEVLYFPLSSLSETADLLCAPNTHHSWGRLSSNLHRKLVQQVTSTGMHLQHRHRACMARTRATNTVHFTLLHNENMHQYFNIQ